MSERTLQDVIEDLDGRLRRFEALADPGVREEVFTILQLVDGLHRTGLSALAERLASTAAWQNAAADDAVRVLLTLYDLLPESVPEPGEDQVDRIGPRPANGEEPGPRSDLGPAAESEAGARSSATDPVWVELPVVAAESSGPPTASPRAASPQLSALRAPSFQTVADLADVPRDRAVVFEGDHAPLLLVRIADEVFAFDPTCPRCDLSLDRSKVANGVLLCPWRNCAYDAGSGRRVDGELHPSLRAMPVNVREGIVRVARSSPQEKGTA